MAYAVKQDIVDRYGDKVLTDVADRNNDGTVDDAAVSKALADAGSEIDAYLSTRYVVPLVPVTERVRQACVDIAIYRLAGTPDVLTTEQRQRYEDVIDWLKLVAVGKAGTGDSASDQGASQKPPAGVPTLVVATVSRA